MASKRGSVAAAKIKHQAFACQQQRKSGIEAAK